jgi:hypothetical protein
MKREPTQEEREKLLRANKRDIGFDLGFLIGANAKGNSTASNFSVQTLLGRPFCVTAGLIRIQAHHVLS